MSYSRPNPSPRYVQVQDLYCTMHQEGEKFLGIQPEDTFPGTSLMPQVRRIKALVERTGALTLPDHGSGKGRQCGAAPVRDAAGNEYPSVVDYWDIDEVVCFDSCYPPFSRLPEDRFDGVIATDVLEHCPEEDMPWIVDEIISFALRWRGDSPQGARLREEQVSGR